MWTPNATANAAADARVNAARTVPTVVTNASSAMLKSSSPIYASVLMVDANEAHH